MRFFLLLTLYWCSSLLASDLVIVNRPYSAADKRDAYAYELLLLALQKTIPQYGQYELRMTNLRLPPHRQRLEPAGLYQQ